MVGCYALIIKKNWLVISNFKLSFSIYKNRNRVISSINIYAIKLKIKLKVRSFSKFSCYLISSC